jgi:hypothetical protein
LPLQLKQGKPTLSFPVPLHGLQIIVIEQKLLPFPPHTIQGTLAPSVFLPVPEQKTQVTEGSSTSTRPVPSQTKQSDIGESNL